MLFACHHDQEDIKKCAQSFFSFRGCLGPTVLKCLNLLRTLNSPLLSWLTAAGRLREDQSTSRHFLKQLQIQRLLSSPNSHKCSLLVVVATLSKSGRRRTKVSQQRGNWEKPWNHPGRSCLNTTVKQISHCQQSDGLLFSGESPALRPTC